jgi:hypothetical protein
LFQGALHCDLNGRQKRVSCKSLSLLSGSSETTKRLRVHNLTSPSTDPNVKCTFVSTMHTWVNQKVKAILKLCSKNKRVMLTRNTTRT